MSKEPDKKITTKAPDPLAEMQRFPVSILRFVNKGQQVAGMQSGDVLKAQKLSNGCHWVIEYFPQIRHHRITYTDPNQQDRSGVSMVHESRVDSWAPVLM